MNFEELRLVNLAIDKQKFGKIFSFVDFGNVNYWYENDHRDWDGKFLAAHQKLIVDIQKLSKFLRLFSEQKRFYYGWHKRMRRSWHIIIWAEKNGFIKITKEIQFIRHYMDGSESGTLHGDTIQEDHAGKFIEIPKSNFDVEISVDSIRLMEQYDTFCLLSGDSDFTRLTQFLKRQGKKIIIIASGKVFHTLKETADLHINAQQIKNFIASIKETAPR